MSTTPIKVQFFLTYGVLGALSPIAALVLESKGFTPWQFGVLLAISSLGLLISPIITAWLADRDVDSRKILRAIFVCAGGALSAVYFLDSVSAVTACWAFYSIVYVPSLPLLDGYYFNHEREHGAGAAGADGGYQFVRVWGTAGFLAPNIVTSFIVFQTKAFEGVIWVAVAWCALSFLGTFLLAPSTVAGGVKTKAPTLRAAHILLSPTAFPMCVGLFFVYIAGSAYYPRQSAFLSDEVGIADHWVAIVMSLGVAIEVAYLFGLGPLRRLLRLRGIMLVGLGSMVLRLTALAMFPTPATAIAIQLFHGLEILAMFVLPAIYLDRVAGDGFRNSIQGAFAVCVTVPTRLIGPLMAGAIREDYGETAVLYVSAGLVAVGFLILLVAFKPKPAPGPPVGPA